MSAAIHVIPQRGRIYLAPLAADDDQNEFWLCVSNNARNPRLEEFIAVRLSTTRRPALRTWVPLAAQDAPWTGSVVCDDIGPVFRDQVIKDAGAISPGTMRRVEQGLLLVLGIETPPLPRY